MGPRRHRRCPSGHWPRFLAEARQCLSLESGTHVRHFNVDYFRSAYLTAYAVVPMPVAADGDVVGHTPARIRTVHRAIRVLASL